MDKLFISAFTSADGGWTDTIPADWDVGSDDLLHLIPGRREEFSPDRNRCRCGDPSLSSCPDDLLAVISMVMTPETIAALPTVDSGSAASWLHKFTSFQVT